MYVKIIQSGEFIERYQYEKSPAPKVSKYSRSNARKSTGDSVGNAIGRRYSSALRAQRSFFRLVRANTGRGKAPAMVTLTMLQSVSLRAAWQEFTRFVVRLNKGRDSQIRYIAVPESTRVIQVIRAPTGTTKLTLAKALPKY